MDDKRKTVKETDAGREAHMHAEYEKLYERLSSVVEAAQKVIAASSFQSMPADYGLDEERALKNLKKVLDGEKELPADCMGQADEADRKLVKLFGQSDDDLEYGYSPNISWRRSADGDDVTVLEECNCGEECES